MDAEERVARITRNTAEVLTEEEIRGVIATHERPRAYIGFEPSGALTVAHLITARKIRDLSEAGLDVTVFLADWHAWINDKLGSDLSRIRASGRYMEAAFVSLGVDPERVRFRWAHELTESADYWARVLRVGKATTLARTRRAMSILGRSEEEAGLDTGKLFYPSMQAADIFELPVEIAYGGLDQRRAHVLAREVAHHYGWPVPGAIHTPLLSSLKGGGRMDPVEGVTERKMSKSDPASGIRIPSSSEVVRERIEAAFCPGKEVAGNPVAEIVRYILFPWDGRFEVARSAEHGGPIAFETEAEFTAAWTEGRLHPKDLKNAVAEAVDRLIDPPRRYFADHPDQGPQAFARPPSTSEA
jgi:tyrosyl-tRNA synthetase